MRQIEQPEQPLHHRGPQRNTEGKPETAQQPNSRNYEWHEFHEWGTVGPGGDRADRLWSAAGRRAAPPRRFGSGSNSRLSTDWHRWTQIPIGRRQLRKPATRAGVGAKGAKMGKRSERRNSQLRTCHAAGVVSRIVRMGDGRANPPGEPGSDSPTAETTKYTNDTARQSRNQINQNS